MATISSKDWCREKYQMVYKKARWYLVGGSGKAFIEDESTV